MRPELVIVVVGVIARLLMLALFDPLPTLEGGDTAAFLAQQGFGLEPPGYVWLLDVFDERLVVLLQMALTIATAVFTYVRTGKRWLGLAVAACPFLIAFELRLLTEAIVCDFVWIGVLLLAWPERRWEPLVAGFLFGLASLTNDKLYLMPMLLPLLAVRKKEALIACAFAFLTVLPWQIAHGPKISEGRGGFALWIGTWERNADWQLGGMENWPVRRPDLVEAWREHNDKLFTLAAVDAIYSEPLTVAGNWIVRYPRLWVGTRADLVQMRFGGPPLLIIKSAFFALNLAILALAILGMWRLRRDERARIIAVPIIYLAAVLFPFHAESRYTLPAMLPLIWFAGHAVSRPHASSSGAVGTRHLAVPLRSS